MPARKATIADGGSGQPNLLVLSSLFPSPQEPLAGLFIRERMLRLAARLPVNVVAPVTWSPIDGLIRRWHPHFRQSTALDTVDHGVTVRRPRYFSIPGSILFGGVVAFARRNSWQSRVDRLVAEFTAIAGASSPSTSSPGRRP
jgi:hypothetical protein